MKRIVEITLVILVLSCERKDNKSYELKIPSNVPECFCSKKPLTWDPQKQEAWLNGRVHIWLSKEGCMEAFGITKPTKSDYSSFQRKPHIHYLNQKL